MKVTRKCILDGNTYTMDMPKLTPELLYRIENRGGCIQDVAPELTNEEREFFITGTPPQVWNEMFGGG
jgi:hypothetical protein